MRMLLCLLVLCFSLPLHAETPLVNPKDEAKAREVFRLLRCEVCAGQSIYDSNASLAVDMRAEVRSLIHDGKTEEEILRIYARRYGDSVLMRPPVKQSTWALWFFPFFALLAGGIMVFIQLRKKEAA